VSEYTDGIKARLFERVNHAWDRDKMVSIYNQVGGERRAFKQSVRSHYKTYGLDPMTIIMLVQMAIRLYIWAKDNGFLSSISESDAMTVPSVAVLFAEASDGSVPCDEGDDDDND
jgi:hypothetical protein